MQIFPSLISSDILNLQKTIQQFDSVCDGYHIDVMDDHFVPNLTWGPAFVKAILKQTNLPIHLHLMVDSPDAWLDRVALRKEDLFIFHIEALFSAQEIQNLIQDIKNKDYKVGIAINPKTEINLAFDFLKDVDHVLIMSVQPGFSGQKFMPEVVEKVKSLVGRQEEFNFTIGMDGGIGKENLKMLSLEGVQQFGIASSIFSKNDPVKALQELYKI